MVKRPGAKELSAWWKDLGGADATRAYAAIWRLADAPDVSVPFLSKRLTPIANARLKEIARHIHDLGSATFAVRDRAFQELQFLGDAAEAALRAEGRKNLPLEVRRRVEQLLDSLDRPWSGERLRAFRALAVLEYAHTPEAHRVVQTLSNGAPDAWLTRLARGVIERTQRQN